jgi:hypothetical protein
LIVNTYKIGLHLHVVTTSNERTWQAMGAKHIHVLGMDDKRQVTMVALTVANGKYYLFK